MGPMMTTRAIWNSGQYNTASTLVNYDSRVVVYERKMFIGLSTGVGTKCFNFLSFFFLGFVAVSRQTFLGTIFNTSWPPNHSLI